MLVGIVETNSPQDRKPFVVFCLRVGKPVKTMELLYVQSVPVDLEVFIFPYCVASARSIRLHPRGVSLQAAAKGGGS